MKYAAIADWAAEKECSVAFLCAQLGVVRHGSYYRWLTDGPCQRERTDAQLTEMIREIHAELHGHPGVRRVWAELVVRGVRAARKRVWRLMRAAGSIAPGSPCSSTPARTPTPEQWQPVADHHAHRPTGAPGFSKPFAPDPQGADEARPG